ncbi:hypothetical protein BC829DRAFT_431940 [Chytridium lagenaria]|nr:hypothetical protein BC829DRAFT_431940 [Chytridium lagenaria]
MQSTYNSTEASPSTPSSHLNHTFYASDPIVLWPVNSQGVALPSKQGAVPLRTQMEFDIPFPLSQVAPSLEIPGSACVALRSPSRPPTSSPSLFKAPFSKPINQPTNKLAVRFRDDEDIADASLAVSPRKKGAFARLFTAKSNVVDSNDQDDVVVGSLASPSTSPISSIAVAATGTPEIPSSSIVALEALGVPSMDTLMRKMNGSLPDAQIVSKQFAVKYVNALPQSQLDIMVVKNKASDLEAGAVTCTVSVPQPMVMGTQVMAEVKVNVLDKHAVGRVRAVAVGLSSNVKFDIDSIPVASLHSNASSVDDTPLDISSLPAALFSSYVSNQSSNGRTLTRASPEVVKFPSSQSELVAMQFLDVPKSIDLVSTGGSSSTRIRRRRGQQDTMEIDDTQIQNGLGINVVDASPITVCGPSVKTPHMEIRHHLRIDVYHEVETSDSQVPDEDLEALGPDHVPEGKKKIGKVTMYVPVRVVQPAKTPSYTL